jgi:hypothetical protein
VSGLRFFFRVTLGQADIASHLPFVRQPVLAQKSERQRNTGDFRTSTIPSSA